LKCRLCGQRKARRSCPALGYQICTVCCGTKRLTEIRCPSDCPYLASAREHPPASTLKRQLRDTESLVDSVRDFSERQSQLFFLVASFLSGYEPGDLSALVDSDVTEACRALASTFETASRGLIYEHRPASLPAERLAAALKPMLLEAGKQGGSAYERDAAVVLRRMADASEKVRDEDPSRPRAFLDLLGRLLRKPGGETAPDQAAAPRLIVP
jgi:hypothetical protein